MPAPSNNYFAGVEVAPTSMRAAVVSDDGQIVARREAAYQPDSFTSDLVALISSLREAGDIQSVGLAVPGLVNRETDRVLVSTGIPSFVRADLHADLTKAAGLKLEFENDANAAAYAEYKLGAARDVRDFFYIYIGDNVGGAFVVDGKLWTGASGCAGEIGHTMINPEGVQCECGNIGCLETVASAPNIVRRARERLNRDSTSSLSRLAVRDNFSVADLALEATNGDDFSIMMIERTGKFIGTAVAGIVNLLSPQRVVLGGAVMNAGELILAPVMKEAAKRAFHPCFESTQIVAGELGVDAVCVGAALLARDA